MTGSGSAGTQSVPSAAIRVENLVKRYGGRPVVDDLDLSVRRGEILALLGPNGAGKTTTVEIIEGHREPDGGTVSVLGLDPRRDGARLRPRMGTMLQHAELYSQIRVREAVELFAAFYPRPMETRELLARVGLGALGGRRYRTLSAGERQRLDLAVAIVGRPEVVILDEPTASMDAAGRRVAWDLLRSLRLEGACVLLTTHLLAEAEELADRVAIIDKGRLVALGTPAELRTTDIDDETTVVTTGKPGVAAGSDAAGLAARSPRNRRGKREVRLELTAPLDAGREARLARLDGVVRVRTVRPGVYVIATDAPGALLMELSGWLWALGIEPLGIQLGHASLEDVFLRLIGEGDRR
ncbi:MAG: ABC transporter ATP-binding protein [Chloroflexi bacterium]|nr:ABC transporter ATP-binding protein [Chloroflexota bacterium]